MEGLMTRQRLLNSVGPLLFRRLGEAGGSPVGGPAEYMFARDPRPLSPASSA